jgi:FMN phosphatase YigB (HAD superfamily)
MFQNNRPDRTLKEAFDPDFYPVLGISEEEVQEPIDEFYTNIFPSLKRVTQIRPEAAELVEAASDRGWQIAIATNPLFPLAAILHRLDWAGISARQYDYSIVPSYESFHFAKPNPAYFAELLARFGWPKGALVMVGNDADHDIRAAQAMGIPTFWISNGSDYPEDFPPPNGTGALQDLLPWLDSLTEEELLPDYTTPSAITSIMNGIPAALNTLTQNLSVEKWNSRVEENSWSLTEIACHLRDVEREINLPRIKSITIQDAPFIPGIDSDAWAIERDYQSQDGHAAIHDFVETRKQTLSIMNNLSPEDWNRPAQHAIFGPTDLREITSFVAGHDRLHIRQVHALLSIS